MNDLYLNAPGGRIPISPEIILKYHLEEGMISPFTRQVIVGQDGKFSANPRQKESTEDAEPAQAGSLKPEEENVKLTTSEILDFAQGADSTTGR